MCTGREYAELKNSIFPESALINIGTPKWPYVDHQACVLAGNMRNLNSIFPDSTQINIRTPKRANVDLG